MAFVVRKPGGRWELRESRSTPRGPRSRTLASFATLAPDVIEHAVHRAHGPITAEEVRRLALRAGVPVAEAPADDAAAVLLAELERGRHPSPARRRMLAAALGDSSPASEAERAVGPWLAATPEEHGRALVELLRLADNIPIRRPRGALRFPGFASEPA